MFCSLQKIEADNHWLAVHQLFSWVYDHYSFFFCQGTIKIAFSYFSRDYYFSTITSNSTGGNVLFSSLLKIEADNHWLTRLPTQCTNSSAGFMTTIRLPSSEGGGSTSPAEEKLIRHSSSFIDKMHNILVLWRRYFWLFRAGSDTSVFL